MAEAFAIGIMPGDFLYLTPRELQMAFRGAAKRRRREAQLAMFTAWHSGGFARSRKRLPDLGALLNRLGEQRDMSDRELRTALLGWHNAMGGSVRVVPKGTITGSR